MEKALSKLVSDFGITVCVDCTVGLIAATNSILHSSPVISLEEGNEDSTLPFQHCKLGYFYSNAQFSNF